MNLIRIALPVIRDQPSLIACLSRYLDALDDVVEYGHLPWERVQVGPITRVNLGNGVIEVFLDLEIENTSGTDCFTHSISGLLEGNDAVFEKCKRRQNRDANIEGLYSKGVLAECTFCTRLAKDERTGECLECGRYEEPRATCSAD